MFCLIYDTSLVGEFIFFFASLAFELKMGGLTIYFSFMGDKNQQLIVFLLFYRIRPIYRVDIPLEIDTHWEFGSDLTLKPWPSIVDPILR